MGNAVAKMGLKGMAAPKGMTARELSEETREHANSGGGVQYVTFSGKTGELTFGQEKKDLPDDRFVLAPGLTKKGWMCWKQNAVVGRHEWPLGDRASAIKEHELEDHGPYKRQQDGWVPTLIIQFVGTDGVQYQYTASTKSARNAVADLVTSAFDRVGEGEEAAIPVFSFDKKKFLAQGDWNWKPDFIDVEWLTEEEANEEYGQAAAEAAEKEAEPKPAKQTKAEREAQEEYGDDEEQDQEPEVVEAEPVEEGEEMEAPRKRRRRRRPAA